MSRYLLAAFMSLGLLITVPAHAARCMLITSYNTGYEWNDGIEQGVKSVLNGKCTLLQFNMNTKVHPSEAYARQQGIAAHALIEKWKPDIVIAADDNASRYVVMPFYKNARLPFVFCGVNWSADRYGYPYRNATGMLEVAPIKPLLDIVRATLMNARHAIYLSADNETERTDYQHYRTAYARYGITVRALFVKSMKEWEQGYLRAQHEADFIILGNNGGINDWANAQASRFAAAHAGRLTVTNYAWMQPYTMLALTKMPTEQGEWAAQVALRILAGTSPARIPITPNRRWGMYVNPSLLDKAGLQLPGSIMIKAVKFQP